MALWNRHTEIAKILIQKAAELNFDLTSKDKRGWTVFHLACYQGMKPIVEMMIKTKELFKLNISAKTNEGNTGLQLAEIKEKHDIVNLINEKMLNQINSK